MEMTEMQEPELNNDLIAMIHSYIKDGASVKDACLLSDILPSTLYTWNKRALAEKSGIYLDFLNSVESARAEHKQYYINIVHHAGVHDTLEVLKRNNY